MLGLRVIKFVFGRNHLHVDVSHGSGVAGAEALAEQLQDIYASNNGCLASLDWAQAFDRMRPQISCDSMKAIGLAPPPLPAC